MTERFSSALRRVPRAGWLCIAVAVLNGCAWSLITPPFHVPDEISHFAYVQYMGETGDPPRHIAGDYMSEEERQTLEALRFFSVIGQSANRPIWTESSRIANRRSSRVPPLAASYGIA